MNNFQAVSGKNEPAPVTIALAMSLTELLDILMVESFDRSMTCVEINQCVGCTAAVLAGTSGNRPQRHAVEQGSRRWRAGHDSAAGGEAPRQFDLCTAHRVDVLVPSGSSRLAGADLGRSDRFQRLHPQYFGLVDG